MTQDEERVINVTLGALRELMQLYRAERYIYLLGALAAVVLLVWAAVLMIGSKQMGASQIGLVFGSSGLFAVTGGRVAYFLNRAFNLVDAVVRKLAGIS